MTAAIFRQIAQCHKMATFINKLASSQSDELSSRRPRFTPNGRPLERKKQSRKTTSLPDRLPLSEDVPLYLTQKPKVDTYMSLRECRESRPPVRSDLAGPTPFSYTPRPLNVNTSCIITPKPFFSRREGRVSHSRDDVWTHKVSAGDQMPCPASYVMDNVFGMHQPLRKEPPSFTMGVKGPSTFAGAKDSRFFPTPTKYNVTDSDKSVFLNRPSYSIGRRRPSDKGPSPGPAQYSPNYSLTQASGPRYSMHRRSKTAAGLL